MNSAGDGHHHLISVSLPAILTRKQPYATLTQFCGPATVKVRAHGRLFQVHGGYCNSSPRDYWHYQLDVGLAGYAPTAQDRFVGLAVRDRRAVRGGTFTRAYASMQLAGHTLRSITQRLLPVPASVQVPGEITHGTVTIAKSQRAGTFVFHLRDATTITGSWNCGEKPYNDY